MIETLSRAMGGSLDAAQDLHRELLPGWVLQNLGTVEYDNDNAWVAWVTSKNYLEDLASASGKGSSGAMAWANAVLAAYNEFVVGAE